MVLKINNIKILFVSIIIYTFFYSCNGQTINFNFSGRKVLYSNKLEGKYELILLNLDTKKDIKFDNFDEVETTPYVLFDDGKKIFVNEYNSTGNVYIYDILKNEKTIIDIHSNNSEMAGFNNVSIYNDNFYFASRNKIFAHSLNDFKLVKKYVTDSLISQFAVFDEDQIAVIYNNFDFNTKTLMMSNIYLYDFNNKSSNEIPYRSYLHGWSADRKKLLFNSRGPKVMDFPSFVVYPIESIDKDSLEIFGDIQFVRNDEVIFAGYRKGKDYDSTNLYILNLQSGKIENITDSNTQKEIKSTFY